jgi:hypothetical protein
MGRVSNKPMGFIALLACYGLAWPALTQADAQTPDPRALGIAEAMLDYCAKAYPESAVKHQLQVKRLTEGLSAEALAKVRNSEPYRRAHDAEGDFVSRIDPHNAKKACSTSLVPRK